VTTEKVDLYKLHKAEYVAPKEPVLLKIGPTKYLTVDGEGPPGGEKFQLAVGALYQVAYTTKMAKRFAGRDYKVCQPEGLWYGFGSPERPAVWRWKLLIRVPDFIAAADLKETAATLKAKGKSAPPAAVRLEKNAEGRSVQVLHTSPYSAEPATMERVKAFVESQDLSLGGPHHEIYLSDPRRVAPERLRTILRIPVAEPRSRLGAARRTQP
jgi:hypothetical protein